MAKKNVDEYKAELFDDELTDHEKIVKSSNRDHVRLTNAVKTLLDLPAGLEFLDFIMSQADYFNHGVDPNNPHMTYFLQGKRAVGQEVFRLIQAVDEHSFDKIINHKMQFRKEQ